MKTRYLLYVDILGFKSRAEQIAKEKGLDARIIRERFINIIKDKVDILDQKKILIGKKYGESDDWLLVTDSCENIFYFVTEILDHSTGFANYDEIPLEIAIGTGEFDDLAKFKGSSLIIEAAAIDFFKTNIVNIYHTYHKEYEHRSPNSSFVVCTEAAYKEFEPLDRKLFSQIPSLVQEPEGHKGNVYYATSVDRIRVRGNIIKFLEKIGYPENRWYLRLPEMYVPPAEYEDILETLDEKKIVFITGTQEYGKTFTAVKLLWEYFKRGYEPVWHKGRSQRERDLIERRLQDIRVELKPHHIVYIEDPFGLTKYEERASLEREIGTIIDIAREAKDTFIVITSREEVFKEFQREQLSACDLIEFEQKLNIKRPSYDWDKRKQILFNWGEEEDCAWLKEETLVDFVLERMEDDQTLPTPLSIRDFVVATAQTQDEDELREKINEKSQETARAFAAEIKNMDLDKILFLAFFFISQYIDKTILEKNYNEAIELLKIENTGGFDRTLKWFLPDKISMRKNYLELSHPSYYQTIDYLLVDGQYPSAINKGVFCPLLSILAKKKVFLTDVGIFLMENYRTIGRDEREKLLLTLSTEQNTSEPMAMVVKMNFDLITPNVRDRVLEAVCEYPNSCPVVAEIMAEHLSGLNRDMTENIMLKLIENDETAGAAVKVFFEYFEELPAEVSIGILDKIYNSENVDAVLNFVWAPESQEFLYDMVSDEEIVEEDEYYDLETRYDPELLFEKIREYVKEIVDSRETGDNHEDDRTAEEDEEIEDNEDDSEPAKDEDEEEEE